MLMIVIQLTNFFKFVFQNGVPSCCSSDSDEEPVTKQPRLSRRQSRESGREDNSPGQYARSTRSSGRAKRVKAFKPCPSDPGTSKTELSDSDVSSENRFIDDGSYFEVCSYCWYSISVV